MQVHYLVRENLLEVESLRKEHEAIYRELQGCFGLEECLAPSGMLGRNIGGLVLHKKTVSTEKVLPELRNCAD